MGQPPSPRERLLAAAYYLLWGTAFAVAHTQAPLYYLNQNQYFLHGLSANGVGFLADDWLANTTDPTPVFSALVRVTYAGLPLATFYVYYGILLAVYFFSLVSVARAVVPGLNDPGLRCVFMTVLLVIHSAAVRYLCSAGLGQDYFWYAQAGVAGQYALGGFFQPSTFAVLLLLSVALFVVGRPFLAVTSAAAAADFHSTYLLGAAALTVAYQFALLRDRQFRKALLLGLWALLLVAPVVVYNWRSFGPSSPEAFREAQHILAHFRIPHHAVPEKWFCRFTAAQLVWVLAAAWLTRGTRLAPVFGASLGVIGALTLAQQATHSDTLALLFPWRISVYLVPLATAVLLAKALALVAPRGVSHRQVVYVASAVIVALLVAGGVYVIRERLGYELPRAELPVMGYAREHAARGQVYLVPVEVPRSLSANESHITADFRPRRDGGRWLAEFQTFRLRTGIPVFVEFKAIPYKDVEVLEWRHRIEQVRRAYEWIEQGEAGPLAAFCTRHGITHVVTTTDHEIRSPLFAPEYQDGHYRVYRVVAPKGGAS